MSSFLIKILLVPSLFSFSGVLLVSAFYIFDDIRGIYLLLICVTS